jgi:hypothetical protein
MGLLGKVEWCNHENCLLTDHLIPCASQEGRQEKDLIPVLSESRGWFMNWLRAKVKFRITDGGGQLWCQ